MAATVGQTRTLQRRRIIERPRLFGLLDESSARIRTLVAPAGYGKTTLAEQWVGRSGRRGAWFMARRASADVAALALGVARASVGIVEGCDARLREHLRAVPAPAEHVETLAELLGEDLEIWPRDSWLVIDEYQEISRAADAERFVAALVAASPVQVLIASRQRPSWITTRQILYGEVLELNQTALAMDAHEAAEVLVGRSPSSASGLVALANGWPAVIGLAGVSSAEIEGEEQVPESLYRFFADEVLSALGEEVRTGLETLAVAPVLDADLAASLLGDETADTVCSAALDVGVLAERGSHLELHPLARSFLEDRADSVGELPGTEVVERCISHYRRARDWDAAFDVIARRAATDALEPLVMEALNDLLDTARLSTIETWCALASDSGLERPIFGVARAEVALRRGRHAEAQVFAEAAATQESELTFRALSVAGRAAHLASREQEALALYRRAEASASTDDERRDALWGQLVCAAELEAPEASQTLKALNSAVCGSDARDVVRSAAYTLSYQLHLGSLDLSWADTASELVDAVDDPLIASSFQNVYATALCLSARYEEGREISSALLRTIRRYRFEFAIPYALCAAAMASAGLREWRSAERDLKEAMRVSRAARNRHAEQFVYSLLVRLYVQQGRHRSALLLDVPDLRQSLPAPRAEVQSSHALALASASRIDEAMELVDQCRSTTSAVEPLVLISSVDAICALKRRDRDAIHRVDDLLETAFSTGAVDLLVTAYRSSSELLTVLLRDHRLQERVIGLMRRAHDEDLARVLGHATSPGDNPRDRLSPREKEVFDLLCQGLSNPQIAAVLVISEGTVKAHAHHIYDKVGTRSRTALAIHAALERADQATSATDADADGSS